MMSRKDQSPLMNQGALVLVAERTAGVVEGLCVGPACQWQGQESRGIRYGVPLILTLSTTWPSRASSPPRRQRETKGPRRLPGPFSLAAESAGTLVRGGHGVPLRTGARFSCPCS